MKYLKQMLSLALNPTAKSYHISIFTLCAILNGLLGPSCTPFGDDEIPMAPLYKELLPYQKDSSFRLQIERNNSEVGFIDLTKFQREFIVIQDDITGCQTLRETYKLEVRDIENQFLLRYFQMAETPHLGQVCTVDQEKVSISIEQNGQLIFSSPFTQRISPSSHPNRTTYRSGSLEWSIDADSGLVYAQSDSVRITLVP